MEYAFFGLLAYCIAREVIFVHTLNKMVNKLMSRNYHEYKAAEEVYKPQVKIHVPNEPVDDLGALSGLNPVL